MKSYCNRKIFTGLLIYMAFITLPVFPDVSNAELLNKGKVYYSNGEYLEALYFFDEIIEGSDNNLKGDAYFWAVKSQLAAGEIDGASLDLEHFLLNYPRNENYSEGFYYKGRILFLQSEYEKSLELFNRFIRSNPFSPFSSNAYFWIGECLYNTGYFTEALDVYEKVVNEYPMSFKYEAAQYKIFLIDYRFREEELLRLIRWSHEESMRTIEAYRNREKDYLQTIAAYQKKILELEGGEGEGNLSSDVIRRLNTAARLLEEYVSSVENSEVESEVTDDSETP